MKERHGLCLPITVFFWTDFLIASFINDISTAITTPFFNNSLNLKKYFQLSNLTNVDPLVLYYCYAILFLSYFSEFKSLKRDPLTHASYSQRNKITITLDISD
jgi:hypothetical protein